MTQAFSVQDLEYLTNLGPAALNDGPIAALEQAWRECLAGQVVRSRQDKSGRTARSERE